MLQSEIQIYLQMGDAAPIIKWLKKEGIKTEKEALERLKSVAFKVDPTASLYVLEQISSHFEQVEKRVLVKQNKGLINTTKPKKSFKGRVCEIGDNLTDEGVNYTHLTDWLLLYLLDKNSSKVGNYAITKDNNALFSEDKKIANIRRFSGVIPTVYDCLISTNELLNIFLQVSSAYVRDNYNKFKSFEFNRIYFDDVINLTYKSKGKKFLFNLSISLNTFDVFDGLNEKWLHSELEESYTVFNKGYSEILTEIKNLVKETPNDFILMSPYRTEEVYSDFKDNTFKAETKVKFYTDLDIASLLFLKESLSEKIGEFNRQSFDVQKLKQSDYYEKLETLFSTGGVEMELAIQLCHSHGLNELKNYFIWKYEIE